MSEIAWKLSANGQLAVLLEASSPKPGNVSRLRRFSDTGYRHFLASATLLGRGLYIAASRGVSVAEGEVDASNVLIGELVYQCAEDVFTGLNRRNTLLGTILLHVPLVVSIAAGVKEKGFFDSTITRSWISTVLGRTTNKDAIDVYRAFHFTRQSGEMNKEDSSWTKVHDRYDIDNPNVYDNLRKDDISLIDLFQKSASVDTISREWSEDYELTLTQSHPYLSDLSESLEDLEEAIVKTFIWLLSKQPDGLIAKKAGWDQAEEVTRLAQVIVEGGFSSNDISNLDVYLRSDGNLLNPGSTADLVSAAILCRLAELQFPKP
ncbi:MAG: triphosphoribosyl-dephospho-CoA synthase [Candidatus Thorarchaeota archaeon]|nr:MAG: triphosphoribosyl-dephospho-CoA synthase [Candidatus Thorarchaeota archaeon]